MRLTWPQLELNLEPAEHSTCHALLHMASKWSSHRTMRAELTVLIIFPLILPTITIAHMSIGGEGDLLTYGSNCFTATIQVNLH